MFSGIILFLIYLVASYPHLWRLTLISHSHSCNVWSKQMPLFIPQLVSTVRDGCSSITWCWRGLYPKSDLRDQQLPSEHLTVHLKHCLVEPGYVQTLPGRGCLRMFNQTGIYKWDKHIHIPCLRQPMKLSCKHHSVLFTAMIQAYHHLFPTCCFSDSLKDNGSDSTPDFSILGLHSQDITLIGSLGMQPTQEEALGIFPGEFWEVEDICYNIHSRATPTWKQWRNGVFWSACTW